MKRYLTSGQAAVLIGISKSTLLRAVNDGTLRPAARTPRGNNRFTRGQLEAFVHEKMGWADAETLQEARES